MDISVNLFGDYNENNQNNEMGSNLKNESNTKKSFEESSKTVVSRKNILTERKNETSEESSCFKRSDFDKKSNIASNSSSGPLYDPLTNYLSPRPKFLRYNPDRTPHTTSLSPPGIESTGTQSGNEIHDNVGLDVDVDVDADEQELEEDEIEDGEDEIEENEDEFEEKSWNLKSVLKALIVFVALFLLTDYISNMNSPITQPLTKNAACLVQNPLVDVVSLKCFEDRNAKFVVDKLDETKVWTLIDLNERVGDEFDENMGLTRGGEIEDVSDHNIDEIEVGLLDLKERVSHEFDENMGLVQAEELEDNSDHDMDVELEAQEKVESLVDHVMSKNNVVNGEILRGEMEEIFAEGYEKCSDLNDEKVELEAQEKVESLVDHVMSKNNVVNGEILRGEMEEIFAEGYEKCSDLNDEVVTLETMSIDESNPKLTINCVAQQIRTIPIYMTSKSITVGIYAICSFVALLALGFHCKFKRTSADVEVVEHQEHSEKVSTCTLKPCSARSKAEKNIAIATKNHESCSEKIESVATPSTLIYPMEEEQASKGEYYETRAPTVEPLGEFEVGEMSCSLIKSCQNKSNRMMESDLSNYSISREEIASWSNTRRQVATPKHSSSEVSLTDSPSYGTFTSEKRRQSEEITTPVRKIITTSARKVMTTTPVRRSSRLQNRTALSP